MFRAALAQTFDNLRANKLRSLLTMFGITWGILSLILMTSMGEGFRVAQKESIKDLGINIMIVWGGRTSVQGERYQAGRDVRLTYADYEAIRDKAPLIEAASPEIIRSDLVSRTPINFGSFSVHGILPSYQRMRSLRLEWGRHFNDYDDQQQRAVCLIGSEANDQLFEGRNSVGETLKIGGHPFTVVGVLRYKDQNNSYSGQDRRSLFIPYETLRKLFSNPSLGESPELINNLILMPASLETHDIVERQVREVLGREHHFHPEDADALPIWNTARQTEMLDTLFVRMQQFLGAVAVITLVLGAIGVVNIMLISVRERTVEIGLRKSLGARRRDILLQFGAESLTLTLISGAAGLALGWGIAGLVNLLPLPTMIFAGMIITPRVTLGAFATLVTLGVAAAVYPARLAAGMDPVEALRFEAN